ncbi:uncharacterized protein [Prorops nasuta]|uniref:uncharacterized protein n=1 Tax=Prorops nasuta TaxID=863751 RepID=UPI0034CEEC96
MVSTIFFILGLSSLWTVPSSGAPAQDLKTFRDPNSLSPVLSTCTPSGRCWDWLNVPDFHDDTYIIPGQLNEPRLLTRRQISPEDSGILGIWNRDGQASDEESPISIDKRNPHRLIKRVFTSQGWGAGGLPFSVLYMIPPNTLSYSSSNAAGHSQHQEQGRIVPRPSPTPGHPADHISVRNGQTRRSYPSIIPQLFISHGWGPVGK